MNSTVQRKNSPVEELELPVEFFISKWDISGFLNFSSKKKGESLVNCGWKISRMVLRPVFSV